MQSLQDILVEMEHVLDRLIENAERLLELSKQVIIEDEVCALQKAQNDMLTQLTELDSQRAAAHGSNDVFEKSMRAQIDEKIDVFQALNAHFIENLSASHGLIHFEDDQIKSKNPMKSKV